MSRANASLNKWTPAGIFLLKILLEWFIRLGAACYLRPSNFISFAIQLEFIWVLLCEHHTRFHSVFLGNSPFILWKILISFLFPTLPFLKFHFSSPFHKPPQQNWMFFILLFALINAVQRKKLPFYFERFLTKHWKH